MIPDRTEAEAADGAHTGDYANFAEARACSNIYEEAVTLGFYPTIQACRQGRDPQVLLLSAVIPYLPDPRGFLREAAASGCNWIVLDRTPFSEADQDRPTVETVSPRIDPATYPAWFLSRRQVAEHRPPGWEIVVEFDALDRQLLDGVELIFKGLALRCTS